MAIEKDPPHYKGPGDLGWLMGIRVDQGGLGWSRVD